MSVPRRVVLSPEARADLRSISAFTRKQWGAAQRRAYSQRLRDAFDQLAQFPGLGEMRPEYGPAIRGLTVGQHVVFYVVVTDALNIVRVLHVRRDADAELG